MHRDRIWELIILTGVRFLEDLGDKEELDSKDKGVREWWYGLRVNTSAIGSTSVHFIIADLLFTWRSNFEVDDLHWDNILE
jgi:hypothetical protein